MNNIPKEILDFAASAALGDISEKIGNEFRLHVDQIGELDAQIRHVLRGFSQAANFTADVMKYVEVDRETAEKITVAVNKEVFQQLKDRMQKNTVADQQTEIYALEKVGGFSVDRPDATETTPADESTIENRAHLIDGIEHPVSGSEKISRKETGSFTSNQATPHVEPLVDQLLNGSVAQTQQKIVATPPVPATVSQTPPAPVVPKGPDLYREPIK